MSAPNIGDGSHTAMQDGQERDQPTAGPSQLPSQNESALPPTAYIPAESRPGPSRPRKQAGQAAHRHLPKTAYGSIEYPGPVSHVSAITNLTSQEEIDTCFNTSSGSNPLLEIHYRKDKTGAPARGYRVNSQKLLVKVVKRKRKDGEGGVFTTEVVGPINHTVRFRCKFSFGSQGDRVLITAMADWHYTPNPDGPTQQLLTTLKNLDCMSYFSGRANSRRHDIRLQVPRTGRNIYYSCFTFIKSRSGTVPLLSTRPSTPTSVLRPTSAPGIQLQIITSDCSYRSSRSYNRRSEAEILQYSSTYWI